MRNIMSVLDELKPNEPFYVDILKFEKHQQTGAGELARTYEYFKTYTNMFETVEFLDTTPLEEALYQRLYHLRARYSKPVLLSLSTFASRLLTSRGRQGYRRGPLLDALKKLEQNQLINVVRYRSTNINTNTNKKGGFSTNRKEEDVSENAKNAKNEKKQPNSQQPPSTYFDYEKQFFVGIRELKIKDRNGLEHLQFLYPNIDIEKEINKAAAWLIEKNDKTKTGGYPFLNNWMKNAQKLNK